MTDARPDAPESPQLAPSRRKWPWLALGCISVPIAALVIFDLFFLNETFRRYCEKDLSAVLGTQMTVGDMKVSLLRGEFIMEDVRVRNVEGYKSEYLARIGRLEFQEKLLTMKSPLVEMPYAGIEDADFNIEFANGTHNWAELYKRIKEKHPDLVVEKGKSPQKGHTEVVRIRNTRLNLINAPFGGTRSIPLDMERKDWTDDFLMPRELVVRIVGDVTEKVDGVMNSIPGFLKGGGLFGGKRDKPKSSKPAASENAPAKP
ncbi:MAG TPA: hypothetical protein PL033_16170 [Candidatus Brocadiia bacterium]|nr:hypothetical protein [Candidatus Brocadiia bacterium]